MTQASFGVNCNSGYTCSGARLQGLHVENWSKARQTTTWGTGQVLHITQARMCNAAQMPDVNSPQILLTLMRSASLNTLRMLSSSSALRRRWQQQAAPVQQQQQRRRQATPAQQQQQAAPVQPQQQAHVGGR